MKFFLLISCCIFVVSSARKDPVNQYDVQYPSIEPSPSLEEGSDTSCRTFNTPPFSAHDFPSIFLFGTATAAFQIEGGVRDDGRGESIWDTFTKVPGNIEDGDNASVADDSYHKFQEDVLLLKSMGVDSYRFSLSWSRLLPSGTGDINPSAVDYYNSLIDSLIASGISPTVTLYHWDLPEALHVSMGGWLNATVVEYFKEYADVAFRLFGDRVKTWITFNEPMEVAVQGYASGNKAPGRCSSECPVGNSSLEPYIVGHNILRSHAAAVKSYRDNFQSKGMGGRIGITIDSYFYFPLTNSTQDRKAAETAIEFYFGWFGDPVITGDYPTVMKQQLGSRLPAFSRNEVDLLRDSVDFIGVNSYTGRYASVGSPPSPGDESPLTDSWTSITEYDNTGHLIGAKTASEWLYVVPESIHSLIMWVKSRYGDKPILITENGTSERGSAPVADILCDIHRVHFFWSYLAKVLEAIKEGANVQGYYSWSLLDNFEWDKGYSERFGLYYVDFEQPHRPRRPKLSALWWTDFLKEK